LVLGEGQPGHSAEASDVTNRFDREAVKREVRERGVGSGIRVRTQEAGARALDPLCFDGAAMTEKRDAGEGEGVLPGLPRFHHEQGRFVASGEVLPVLRQRREEKDRTAEWVGREGHERAEGVAFGSARDGGERGRANPRDE
jgi:hypothetical protein